MKLIQDHLGNFELNDTVHETLPLIDYAIIDENTFGFSNPNYGIGINLKVKYFLVRLSNRLISTGLELVFSHTEKSCIAPYYEHFSTNIKLKNI